jgi:hypothetical protein
VVVLMPPAPTPHPAEPAHWLQTCRRGSGDVPLWEANSGGDWYPLDQMDYAVFRGVWLILAKHIALSSWLRKMSLSVYLEKIICKCQLETIR